MQTFVISPSDNVAGVLDEKEGIVRLVSPAPLAGQKINASHYASRFPSSTLLRVEDDANGMQEFECHKYNSMALDFTLILFDAGVSRPTRTRVAEQLHELLYVDTRRDHVLDIMFSAPLPKDADTQGAESASKAFEKAWVLVSTIVERQPEVQNAFASWLSLIDDENVRLKGVNIVHGQLIRQSVFRMLVENGRSKLDKPKLNACVVFALKDVCEFKLLQALVNEYCSHLPQGLSLARVPQLIDHKESLSPAPVMRGFAKSTIQGNWEQKLAQVESQIDRIVEEFSRKNDGLGRQFLEQLIAAQTQNTNNHTHVVKSLCNIASKCRVHGRRDITFDCLARAREFRSGVDAHLYIQIGQGLREIRDYEQALKFYEEAKLLDRGELRESIELEIIRITADRGDYPAAIQKALSAVGLVDLELQYLTQLGTLYRKSGSIPNARYFYNTAWVRSKKTWDGAAAGLAECNKQTGRHRKAIQAYLSLNAHLDKINKTIEEGRAKVYALALSRLYRITHQPQRALAILKDLEAKYPSEADVQLQLAKLYIVEGDTKKARHHFQLAQGPNLETIAAKLFAVAQGQQVAMLDPDSSLIDTDILPEDVGLLRCGRALMYIEADRFEAAQRVVNATGYVDRLHSDFGAVLSFHATRKLDSTFNYKSNQVLARIAKRGYRELRKAIPAIASGDFATAKALELRVCANIA